MARQIIATLPPLPLPPPPPQQAAMAAVGAAAALNSGRANTAAAAATAAAEAGACYGGGGGGGAGWEEPLFPAEELRDLAAGKGAKQSLDMRAVLARLLDGAVLFVTDSSAAADTRMQARQLWNAVCVCLTRGWDTS